MMDNWEVLKLTSDDPCRTTLEQKDTEVVSFSSKTDDKKSGSRPLTTFANADGEEIAQLEWHMYFSDKLRLRGGEWMNVSKWIKSKKDMKGAVVFTCTTGNQYYWTSGNQGSTLWLYASTDSSNPIAAYQPRGKKNLITDPPPPAPFIQLSHHTKVDRDEILLSLLLIEKARRFGSKPFSSTIGDGLFYGGIGPSLTRTMG